MATYKVIQDIEAEDKLVGPLTLRQFIYAAIAAILGYLSVMAVARGVSLLLIFLLPPALFTGFFAFPWGRDQPTEVWALAKIRFHLKSRKRLWDQSGVKDLVNITVPKREVKQYTNGLSAHEVQSRLTALATTLDTRGWAVKNVYNIPAALSQPTSTDRLLDISALPREVPTDSLSAADDMLDEDNNPRAQQLEQMVVTATANHKQQLLDEMRRGTMPAPVVTAKPEAAANYWFVQKPVAAAAGQPAARSATPLAAAPANTSASDAQMAELLREHRAEAEVPEEHLKTIQPLGTKIPASPPSPSPMPAPVTPVPDPATMRLAYNNDLNIATIARQANKEKGSGEVVISLHKRN